jgi:hypothetical protein
MGSSTATCGRLSVGHRVAPWPRSARRDALLVGVLC